MTSVRCLNPRSAMIFVASSTAHHRMTALSKGWLMISEFMLWISLSFCADALISERRTGRRSHMSHSVNKERIPQTITTTFSSAKLATVRSQVRVPLEVRASGVVSRPLTFAESITPESEPTSGSSSRTTDQESSGHTSYHSVSAIPHQQCLPYVATNLKSRLASSPATDHPPLGLKQNISAHQQSAKLTRTDLGRRRSNSSQLNITDAVTALRPSTSPLIPSAPVLRHIDEVNNPLLFASTNLNSLVPQDVHSPNPLTEHAKGSQPGVKRRLGMGRGGTGYQNKKFRAQGPS